MAEPTDPHANQYVHTHDDVYARAANGNPTAPNRHSDHYRDRDAFLYPIPYLHALPDTNSYGNLDPHAGAANSHLYTASTDADQYRHAASADGYGYRDEPCASTAAEPIEKLSTNG